MRHRLAIRYAIKGDLRFLSHQDTLRLFQRAFNRAGIPIRFSEGFNPRPRISIAMPRPVGVESCDELLVIELASWADPDAVAPFVREHAQEMAPDVIQQHIDLYVNEYSLDLDAAAVDKLLGLAGSP